MARNNIVSQKIYRRHTSLFRYLNNAWIFTDLVRPHLKTRADELRASSHKKKRRYPVPKNTGSVDSRRTDADIGQLYRAQWERGIFETNIVSVVSRTEAFLMECLTIAIAQYPQKLTVLSGNSGIPVNLFLEHEDREIVLERFVASQCEGLMFSTPKEYLTKFQKVLGVELDASLLADYIEIKASRDIIIHNLGSINKLYVDKVGKPPQGKARGAEGDELAIDNAYFKHVITTVKRLSGAIQRETERTYK